ncbi:MAG: hypothetical protein AVDCRST_MAG77-1993 [uncultured Chloroflexi bacterium]|uniref:PilZ domain-containing protein n=1 Tax=uncultured Chloroflexota bacterium TaxID=166587 RepID=A0A6J4GZA0_9CHLR|nr:MAG: hypothetical protein AVDCRST_MAG77-1993 [uncultured Chloroflexota bacterium]
MAAGVRNLPGVRPGARIFLFAEEEEDGVATRIENFDADWLAIAAPGAGELEAPRRDGDLVELELPVPGGSLFLVGTLTGRRTSGVPQLVIRIEEVGADPGVGTSSEARRHFRQPLWLPARHLAFTRAGRGGTVQWHDAGAIVRDVSSGGASLFADAEIPLGSTVRLDCPVPLEPFGLVAMGTVVGSRQTGSHRRPRWVVSVRFDDLDRQDMSWLTNQLHRYQWLTRWRQR